jgi:hypothetical protein
MQTKLEFSFICVMKYDVSELTAVTASGYKIFVLRK